MFSTHAAIEFIVTKIGDEAARRDVPLSDIERQMLYFSESQRIPRKMLEIMEAFERDYDEAAYEQKVVALLRSAYKRTRSTEKNEWATAIRRLQDIDVYLGVMMDQAGLFRRRGDRRRLLVAGNALFLALLWFGLYVVPFFDTYLGREEQVFYLWTSALALAGLYTVARWIVGGNTVDHWTNRVIDTVLDRKRDRTER